MNSTTVYAVAKELNNLLLDTNLTEAREFPGHITLYLKGEESLFVHLLTFEREPQLILSDREIANINHSRKILTPIYGATIHRVESLGLDRFLLVYLRKRIGWDSNRPFLLRLNMIPHGEIATLFHSEGQEPLESIGAKASLSTPYPKYVPQRKNLQLNKLPLHPPQQMISAIEQIEFPQGTPMHTIEWNKQVVIARILVDEIEGLDPYLASHISKSNRGDPAKIWNTLLKIGRNLSKTDFRWYFYLLSGEKGEKKYSLYPLKLPGTTQHRIFKTFREATSFWAEKSLIPDYISHLKQHAISRIRREIIKYKRLIRNLSKDQLEAEKAKEYRHMGNLLAANRHLMKRGDSTITVGDFCEDRDIEIPITPSKSPDENIKSYYKRAKKGERGLLIIKNRKRRATREIDKKKKVIEKVKQASTIDELYEYFPQVGIITEEKKKTRYKSVNLRQYRLDDRHKVYIGRNARENDLLTHQFASKRDLWLHVRGASGSHVILKGYHRSTPKSIILRAASIAAWFSKARHSKTVPVIYTEKRYIRKPKKSPPGTATWIRGTTIFVSPSPPDKEK